MSSSALEENVQAIKGWEKTLLLAGSKTELRLLNRMDELAGERVSGNRWCDDGRMAELPIAERIPSLDLIAYQDGAVVSRTLLKRASGTVTLFAFDRGQGLSEHTAPFDALVHVLDGEAEIVIAGTSHQVAAGDLMLMPANQPHALTARTPFKMLLTMLRS